jgi:SAM-dependent methyltransferase
MPRRGRPGGDGASDHRLTESDVERANRVDWDAAADEYQREHGVFLRDAGFVWSPEGVDEADVRLLGDVSHRRVLEVGCGAAQCSRWLQTQRGVAVGFDLSLRQLQHSRRIDEQHGTRVPVVCATVTAIPFADRSFDLACSAFGALPFVSDLATALGEVARVLRVGARFVFSVVHPVRWMFPDDPSRAGLTVVRSYFDRAPYVEVDDAGHPTYVEPHHTLADWVDAITSAGFGIERMTEPEWPPGHERTWGWYGPVRGALVPGTLIFSAVRLR